MEDWKKRIFINVIQYRIKTENKDIQTILNDYPKLTETEKEELVSIIQKQYL